jgi:NTP pyrophosphatase (non-canonical NTP hydrolase)
MTDGRYIAGMLPESAILEQLAEEASELAHASLKLARILRGENPTPKAPKLAEEELREEIADVMVCLEVIGNTKYKRLVTDTEKIQAEKIARWESRLADFITYKRGTGNGKF